MQETQFENTMKLTFLQLLIVALACMVAGCKEGQDQLLCSKEKLCLRYQQQEQCMDAGGAYRLRVAAGRPVLEAMEVGKLLVPPTYPQFAEAEALEAGTLSIQVDGNMLKLKQGEQEMRDESGLGFIVEQDRGGRWTFRKGKDPKTATKQYRWDRKGYLAGTRIRKIDWRLEKPNPAIMYLTTLYFAYGDAANHYIPNDTGTEVVIIDNFKVEGDCSAEVPDSCCPAGEAAGPPIDITDLVDDYAAMDQRLLACFPVNSICTFTDGDKLIILVCESQQRYCLDYSVCNVTITTSDENGICISVPGNCGIENPF